jgi:hypothetical protein
MGTDAPQPKIKDTSPPTPPHRILGYNYGILRENKCPTTLAVNPKRARVVKKSRIEKLYWVSPPPVVDVVPQLDIVMKIVTDLVVGG